MAFILIAIHEFLSLLLLLFSNIAAQSCFFSCVLFSFVSVRSKRINSILLYTGDSGNRWNKPKPNFTSNLLLKKLNSTTIYYGAVKKLCNAFECFNCTTSNYENLKTLEWRQNKDYCFKKNIT